MSGSWFRTRHDIGAEERPPGYTGPERYELGVTLLSWDFWAQIGLHRRFAVEVFVPTRANVVRSNRDGLHHRDEVVSGVGDIVVAGRIGLVRPDDVARWNLDLRLGISQPTARTRPNPFERAAAGLSAQHMFFGSGTFDPIVGLETQVVFDRFQLVGWAQAKIPLARNRFEYRASRQGAAAVGAQTSFGLKRWSFLAQPEIYLETPAQWADQAARNSGRLSLLATAGVFAVPHPAWQVQLIAKVPYFTRARGGQIRWPIIALLGATYTFSLGHGH